MHNMTCGYYTLKTLLRFIRVDKKFKMCIKWLARQVVKCVSVMCVFVLLCAKGLYANPLFMSYTQWPEPIREFSGKAAQNKLIPYYSVC